MIDTLPRAVQRDLRAPRAAGVAEATKELKAALDDVKKQEA